MTSRGRSGQAGVEGQAQGAEPLRLEADPDYHVYFKTCIFSGDGTEVWFGDLDLVLDEEKLERLAARIGPISEHPYRFDGFSPQEADDERIRRFPVEGGGGDRSETSERGRGR